MTTEPNYENMFKAAVMDLAEVSVALGIPDQVTLTANGNAEILAAIHRKNARIAELQAALREAMGWDWQDKANPPPQEIVDQCNRALEER